MNVKIGIVGASFAKAAYLPALKHIEGVEVTAISSFNIQNAKSCAEEFKVNNFFTSSTAPLSIILINREFTIS